MSEERRYTEAADVVPPPLEQEAETVELIYLGDRKTGLPIKVLVRPLSELELLDVLPALPGSWNPDEMTVPDLGLAEQWARFAPLAQPLIERSCTPRFSWAEPAADGCLPGKWLRDSERFVLAMTTLRLSGGIGDLAALAASFLGLRRERAERAAGAALGDDAGTVGAVPGEAVPAERDAGPAAPDGEGADASAGVRRDGIEGAEGGAAVPAGVDAEAGGVSGGGDESVAA